MTLPNQQAAADEFDQWAAAGRANRMAIGHESMVDFAISTWALQSNSMVVDVGCGGGSALKTIVTKAGCAGLGVDISPLMIAQAQHENNNKTIQKYFL